MLEQSIWAKEYRPNAIFKRHLAGIESDRYFTDQLKILGLNLQIGQLEDSLLTDIQKNSAARPFIPAIVTDNISAVIQANPITVIGVCLVPRGRLRMTWKDKDKELSLDLFLAYKEVNPVGRREIKSAYHQQLLMELLPIVRPVLNNKMMNDPSLGRILKYMHQLEQIQILHLDEAHFILSDNLYSSTFCENARLAGFDQDEIANIPSLVTSYASRERNVISKIIQHFFPDLADRVKIIIPTQGNYAQGLRDTEEFTQKVRQYYQKIPVEFRAMAAYAMTPTYEQIDISAIRLWLSDINGQPALDRPKFILAHIKNFKPASRFLLQSLMVQKMVKENSQTGLLLTTGGPSLFHRTEQERSLYWETERSNDDDYAALPEQGICIGEEKEMISCRLKTMLNREVNRSTGQSRIYWITRDLGYYFDKYYIHDDARELATQAKEIISNWDTPNQRNYAEAINLIPEFTTVLKHRLWEPLSE